MVFSYDKSILVSNGHQSVMTSTGHAAFSKVHSSNSCLISQSVAKMSRYAIDCFCLLFIFSAKFCLVAIFVYTLHCRVILRKRVHDSLSLSTRVHVRIPNG